MIRYLTIIVDMSKLATKQDIRPNRAIVTKNLLSVFIKDFVDQNPLSKLSVIVTYNQTARLLSDFNKSPSEHVKSLVDFT